MIVATFTSHVIANSVLRNWHTFLLVTSRVNNVQYRRQNCNLMRRPRVIWIRPHMIWKRGWHSLGKKTWCGQQLPHEGLRQALQ